jgi:hypothetical protein
MGARRARVRKGIEMKDLWNSKKFAAALVVAIVAGFAFYFGLPEEKVLTVVSGLLAFIGVQGLADLGKGKALVEAAKEPPGE